MTKPRTLFDAVSTVVIAEIDDYDQQNAQTNNSVLERRSWSAGARHWLGLFSRDAGSAFGIDGDPGPRNFPLQLSFD